MFQEGDARVEEYNDASYQAGDEFVVDCIVAERQKKGSWEYLVKWKVRHVSD